MVIKPKILIIPYMAILTSCAMLEANDFKSVYTSDFQSENILQCKPSDVPLSNSEVTKFFNKSKIVSYKIIHDNYNRAPCYIEGTMKYKSAICDWVVRAGYTGHIECDGEIKYFACDDCDELFVFE